MADLGVGSPQEDPLLARARADLRGGRLRSGLRGDLLASRDPHHRHAARLLQAIAGEEPAPILSRAGAGPARDPLPPQREPEHEPVPRPKPDPELQPEPEPELELDPPRAPGEPPPSPAPSDPAAPGPAPSVQALDDHSIDPIPDLNALPDGLVRAWFSGVAPIDDDNGDPPSPADPNLGLAGVMAGVMDRLVGEELLLLRERPPARLPPPDARGEGPRLVILTRLGAGLGSGPDEAILELAGAGPAIVELQPLDSTRVRLRVVGAGAVPAFLAATPELAAGEILDVGRHEGVVEIEIGLAPGWWVADIETLAAGARVRFAREPADFSAPLHSP